MARRSFDDDVELTLSGEYDRGDHGRRPEQRAAQRQALRRVVDVARWSHQEWQVMTEEDAIIVQGLAAILADRATDFLIVRRKQSQSAFKRGDLG